MNWRFLFVTSTILCGFMEVTEGSNILVVMPLPARSYSISFQPFWEELIKTGHNLTIITGFELSNQFQSNYTMVNVKPVFKKFNVDLPATRKYNRFYNIIFLSNMFQEFLEEIFKYPDVQDLINSNNKYDLVIAQMMYIDAILAFGYKFNAPVLTVSPLSAMLSHYNWIQGNPFSSSYTPSPHLPFSENMSLFARIVNMIHDIFQVLFYEFISLPNSQSQIEKYFNFEKGNTPHIKDIIKNISVSLVTSHYSFGYLKPDLPNIVNIGGLHLTSPPPLPKDIQKFMDEADYGIIYLSLGSFIEPNKVEDLGRTFIRVMENLPQRVIMKWDSSLLPYIPKNFLVQNWISQEAILNHPKCRVFITHGGLHSSLEALNASVPLIVIPFFADQQYNRVVVEYYGIGTAVQVDDVSKELLGKIEEVLRNPKYKKNIMKRSLIFRDRPNKPLETAMYWVDHVIKHKDTVHFKSASVEVTWYELYSIDVLFILVVIFYIILRAVEFIIQKIKGKLLSAKDKLFPHVKSRPNEKEIGGLKCD